MDLIQNTVLNKEGKKWKQRWAILRKVSPNLSSNDSFYYLFLYKDASHARIGKEKHVLPLNDFCGMNNTYTYDKSINVLIIITVTQTMFLAFDLNAVRDQWEKLIQQRFGECITYDVSIPDKQKLKAGHATIRLYQSFFAIITNKHYKCLKRWLLNDIIRYSAFDNSHFVFEIAPPNKAKGQLFNLLVPNNAYEIAKTFDNQMCESNHDSMEVLDHNDFHGSAILDELSQARRISGEQNFFQRVVLRASNRMRRNKKRDRSQSTPSRRKHFEKEIRSPSMNDESKFRSLDRRKNPDLGIFLDEQSVLTTMNIVRCQSHPTPDASSISPGADVPPPLPDKITHSHQPSISSDKFLLNHGKACNSNSEATFDGSSLRTESNSNDGEVNGRKLSENKEVEENDLRENGLSGRKLSNKEKADDNDKHSNMPDEAVFKSPAKASVGKAKKTNKRSEQKPMPTPPPRSPISLGFEPSTVFKFPSTDNVNEFDSANKFGNKPNEIDIVDVNSNNFGREQTLSNDAFIASNDSPSLPRKNPTCIEPVYGNLEAIRNDNNNSMPANMNIGLRKHHTKHQSDPLSVESWTLATGDGKISNQQDFSKVDYVNVKGKHSKSVDKDLNLNKDLLSVHANNKYHSDDDNDSYVNVRKKPKPFRIKSYKNDFEKYDDDDPSIYHAVGALDDDRLSHGSDITNQGSDGSYENVNAARAKSSSDYLNLTSPKNKTNAGLNYIMVGGKEPYRGNYMSNSNSPVRMPSRSPSEVYEKSDYTRIDENMTGALSRSMQEHRQQREKSKIPSKLSK